METGEVKSGPIIYTDVRLPRHNDCCSGGARSLRRTSVVEDSVASIEGRHRGQCGDALGLTYAFIVREEKSAVLDHGAANRAAQLVSFKRWNCGSIEEIPSIQRAVSDKSVNASLQPIRPGASNCVDDAAGSLSIFGRVIAREDGELLNGIYAQVSSQDAARCPVRVIVDTRAVETIIVLLWTGARDR